MKKIIFTTLLLTILIGTTFYIWKDDVEPAITYFPIDDTSSFEQASTQLSRNDMTTNPEIAWDSFSETKEPSYLRQDLSLLYKDGYFKGILNKWKENEHTIKLHQTFSMRDDGYLQAISFHFGEIHRQDEIKSIHAMSYNDLSINKPTKNKHKSQVNDSVQKKWTSLLSYFDIDDASYHIVPLVDLHIFNDRTIPSLNRDETDKVIGQLWEGLYKNYALPILQQKDESARHVMPLILFDKHAQHLLVLFELQGEKIQLVQKY